MLGEECIYKIPCTFTEIQIKIKLYINKLAVLGFGDNFLSVLYFIFLPVYILLIILP